MVTSKSRKAEVGGANPPRGFPKILNMSIHSLSLVMIKIGIIGGSGLDNPEILTDYKEIEVDTPYGSPSSKLTVGRINNVDVVILARHGKKHSIMPSNINYRANIHALKEQGCTHILATTSVGYLREQIEPGHLVFIDQFIDRTSKRISTFYDKDKVCHLPMAEPFCKKLRRILADTSKELNLRFHSKGTVVTIEGPRFSTKAESNLYRSWGADIINMSTVPEVILAREAGLCYAVIAMSTDYDCFLEGRPAVTIDEVLNVTRENSDKVKDILIKIIPKINFDLCECREHVKNAII